MSLIETFITNNVNYATQPLTCTVTFNTDFIIQAKGYPSRYLVWNEIYYNGERIDEHTNLDVDALGLVETKPNDEFKDIDVTSLVVIPKGKKVELYFNPDDFDSYYETFTKATIMYNGIKIITNLICELDDIIDSIEK